MANVTDSASVLVVPSGWSDGVLGSLQPDDGSSDFTFSRGSDLSATRVNEQGYIEKGYENLLLHSNTFDTTWTQVNVNPPVSGYEGYDGSNNAWLLQNNTNSGFVNQNISNNGISVFSAYAKAGNVNFIRVRADYSSIATTYFDLNPNTIGNRIGTQENNIDAYIEDVGNGWYKCSIVYNGTTTRVRLYPAITDGDTLGLDNSIYIQDAMLNQGLVAYPYIETTTTTAKNAVILEDQPRIDYTSGNGSVLIEPQRTNILSQSEYLTGQKSVITYNNQISPEGLENALKQTGDGSAPYFYIDTRPTLPSSGTYNVSIFVKKGTTDWFRIRVRDLDTFYYANFNITSKVIGQHNSITTPQIVDYLNDWKRISMTFETTILLKAQFNIAPMDGDEDEQFTDTSLEYAYFYGLQCEKGSNTTSYVPTYGTSQTRLKDTATLTKNVNSTGTIYININAQTSRTLTFLGADISVTEGVNKIAMAYSPTALKVSKNGTIVANITRAFDTTALTQIQLGHRNNFEQVTDSYNQFLTLDSFLSDTQLNELTA